MADAVVDAFANSLPGQGQRLVDRALREGIDSVKNAPEPLRELFRELDHRPAWVDQRAIDRGDCGSNVSCADHSNSVCFLERAMISSDVMVRQA